MRRWEQSREDLAGEVQEGFLEDVKPVQLGKKELTKETGDREDGPNKVDSLGTNLEIRKIILFRFWDRISEQNRQGFLSWWGL